jgi:hypothetical protein
MIFFARELDFYETLYRASDPKLEHGPFKQDLSDVTELPALALSNAFEFPAQVLADTQAYLSLPLTHDSSVRKTGQRRKKGIEPVDIPTTKRQAFAERGEDALPLWQSRQRAYYLCIRSPGNRKRRSRHAGHR